MISLNKIGIVYFLITTAVAVSQSPIVKCSINNQEYNSRFGYHSKAITINDTIYLSFDSDKYVFDSIDIFINIDESYSIDGTKTRATSRGQSLKEVKLTIPIKSNKAIVPLNKYIFIDINNLTESELDDFLDDKNINREMMKTDKLRISVTKIKLTESGANQTIYQSFKFIVE